MRYTELKRFAGLLMVALLVAFAGSAAIAGTVRGVITDVETGQPLTGANIVLEGTARGAATDLDGMFVIFNVAPGQYSARITMLGYDTKVVPQIDVSDEHAYNLDVALTASSVTLETVTFTAGSEQGSQERELEERLEEAAITDAVSKEVLKKLPDPDVANVVRRATGVSVDKGDPIVRGLGVRYSKVTLNNAAISGTEPNRSAVSLELFPSNLMDQVTISKSFLPDQNGEFAGGVVNMSTLSLPKTLQVTGSSSFSYNTATTFNDFKSYQGGNLDWVGFDDGTRALPDIVANATEKINESGQFSEGGYDPNEIAEFGKSFDNNWSPTDMQAMPNMNYSVSIGNQTQLAGKPFGFMVSGLYSKGSSFIDGDKNIYTGGNTPGTVKLWHDYAYKSYTQSVGLGSMAAMRWYLSDLNSINFNMLYSRDVSDEVRTFGGYNDDRGTDIRSTRLRFVAEQTLTNQLFGNIAAPDLMSSTFNWQATYSRGTRYEPDTRETQYEDTGGGIFQFADETYSGSRIFNDLRDDTYSGGLDWTFKPMGRTSSLELKTGGSAMYKDRISDYHRYEFEMTQAASENANFNNSDFLSQEPEVLFAEDNINAGGWRLAEYTRPTDSYTAKQQLYAGYMMAEMPVTSRLFVTGGARYEHSEQKVESFTPYISNNPPTKSDLTTGDVLPAISMRYTLRQRMNLRFAASQTVSRPDFRELSEFEFTDFIGDYSVVGNPDLDRALIRNYDLRWEMVHGVADLIAVSAFVKDFDSPIEMIIENTAQPRKSYINAVGATNYGVEFEIRQNLGILHDQLQTLTVTSNLSLIESEVEVGSGAGQIQTSANRPLVGQSPYLANFGLSYIHPDYGSQVNLFYNTFGERIANAGANGLPDVKESSRHDVDLTARQPLGRQFAVKFAAKNLLDSDYEFTQGGEITETYKRGRTWSVGVTYTR